MGEVTLESQLIEIIKDEDMAEHIKLAKVDMLIKLGCNVNAMYGARSPLRFAKDNNLEKVAELLENNVGKNIFDEEIAKELGKKLIEVCANGEKKDVEELIDMGADVNAENKKGWTALMCASRYGHKEVVELLIQKGADVNAENNKGWTALMLASAECHKEIAEVLIQNGADVNQKNDYGKTALIWASRSGHKEVVELLIQNRADVNQKDDYGKTALMEASVNDYKEVVELLIQNGADVNQKDNYGAKAIVYATDELKKVIIDAVKKRNIKENGRFIGNIRNFFES